MSRAQRHARPTSLILWLVGLLVLALAAVSAAVLTSGGEPSPTASPAELDGPVTVAVVAQEPVTAVPVQDAEEPAAVPLVTYEVFLARDPFEPVVPEDQPAEPSEPTGDEGGDGAGDDGDANGSGSGSDAGSGSGSGSGGGPGQTEDGCRGINEVVCDGQVVTLLDVTTGPDGEPVAVIQVGTTVYEVGRGQTFAGNFQVRAIDGNCVSLLFGDDGFQLCTGDTVLK